MTDNNLDYQKAIETVDNAFPQAIGFISPTAVPQGGNQTIVAQNNLIIELLVTISQKLDRLSITTAPTDPLLQHKLDEINQQITSLFKKQPDQPKVSKSPQQLVVWKDPRTTFPKPK